MPLEEADIPQDLAKAGVYWELSPVSLSRLRFQVKGTAVKCYWLRHLHQLLVSTYHLCLMCSCASSTFELGSQVCKIQGWHRAPQHNLCLVLQTTLKELKDLHRSRHRQSSAACIQRAWHAHQSRKRHAAFRSNTAAQVILVQGRQLQEHCKHEVSHVQRFLASLIPVTWVLHQHATAHYGTAIMATATGVQ